MDNDTPRSGRRPRNSGEQTPQAPDESAAGGQPTTAGPQDPLAATLKDVLKENIATDLAGKSLQWWQRKLHTYMQAIKDAREELANTKTQLGVAIAKGEEARSEAAALQQQVTQLTADMAAAERLTRELSGRIAELEAAQLGPEDTNDMFAIMTSIMEPFTNNLEKEYGI